MNQMTSVPAEPTLKAIVRHSGPLALWHLLSLDAPTIAALWTRFIASANHVVLPLPSTLAMAIAVWMLYAADRLMDARHLDADPTHYVGLEARHYFHYRHRSAFLSGILLASIALALLLPHLEPKAIHLYLILAGLVSAYFLLIHATRSAAAQQKIAHLLPKEIAVGLFFAAATFIPTIARCPNLRPRLLPFALLFAALCSLNCLFIYAWEHAGSNTSDPHHPITHIALKNLPSLTVLLTLSGAAVTLFDHRGPWPVPYAIALSAAVLLLLHHHRQAIAPVTHSRPGPHYPAPPPSLPLSMRPAPPNFDKIARPYRWLEYLTLGKALENCRLHYLPQLLNRRHALILGDGDGRFLAQLLKHNPGPSADAVDSSAVMLQLLRQRCEATSPNSDSRLCTYHQDALSFPLKNSYDLIVTRFFLDCFTRAELDSLIGRIGPRLAPNALWLISEFRVPSGPMRLPAQLLIRSLYLAFRLLTGLRTTRLPDHATPLKKSGLTRISHQHRLAGLLTSELWQT